VELVIQCPSDCPPEQHGAFFQAAFNWYCNTYLPAGKDCVFVAQVHKDEHKLITTENGVQDISKEHLHLAYVPAVPAGEKHPGFEYRLNADALTKRAVLKEMHPSLQAELDRQGIKATVFSKKNGDGKIIPLTVKQLKEITEKTGVVIDHTLTVDELGAMLSKNVELSQKVDVLTNTVSAQTNGIAELKRTISEKDREIGSLQAEIRVSKSYDISADKEKAELQRKLQEKDAENLKLKSAAQRIISEKDMQLTQAKEMLATRELETNQTAQQNQKLQEQVHSLQKTLKGKEFELQQEREKTVTLETLSAVSKEHTWGADPGWGSQSGWESNTSNTKSKEYVEEINL
jgi:myosin heavy subunit